jgi:hypothetical protein
MAHASAQKLSATDNRKKIPKMEQLSTIYRHTNASLGL